MSRGFPAKKLHIYKQILQVVQEDFKVRRFLFTFLCASMSVYGSAILVSDSSLYNTSTDYLNWMNQLGPDHTSVTQAFYASTSTWDGTIVGQFSTGKGMIVVAGNEWKVTAPSGSGTASIQAQDDLLSTMGDGPVTLNLQNSVYAAGAFVQADGFAQFSARIQAFAGINTVLDTVVTSDSAGDAVFLGVSDTTSEITKIIYSLTVAPVGYKTADFVVDTLYLEHQILSIPPPAPPPANGAPEPGMVPLLGVALLGFGLTLKRRSARI